MLIIIDGYNLLRFIQKNTDNGEFLTDSKMCGLISHYLKLKKQSGTVVFDGIGPRDKTLLSNIDALEVIFSGTKYEADDIIEELICEYSAPKMLIVVSNDRRIISQAKKKKSTSKNCAEFWDEVIETIKKSAKKNSEPPEKRKGITESETKLWLEEFGL